MANILLVGYGKMGSAMAERWKQHSLVIVEPTKDIRSVNDIPAGFAPDAVIFAVKPQTLPDIIGDYARFNALFISIAAGKPISFFEQYLGVKARIIRAMPNTPASIGKGITVAYAGTNATQGDRATAASLLGAVGEVLWVDDERLMDPVTALSGSGPSYVFLLIEALTKAGTEIGLNAALAEKLARQTVIGSAALAAATDTPASNLREAVTSPGGTTEAAMKILMADGGLQDLFSRALKAASERAKELSK